MFQFIYEISTLVCLFLIIRNAIARKRTPWLPKSNASLIAALVLAFIPGVNTAAAIYGLMD
jgi:ABC-type maltose transport system permease subunit